MQLNSNQQTEKFCITYASKICDGIFVGNTAALDFSGFISNNKIRSVVNCSAGEFEVPQYFHTLNLHWQDKEDQVVVNHEIVKQIFNFVSIPQNRGESTLFCCTNGESRALSALIGFLIFKFSWSLFKTLQFLNSSKCDFEIKASYLQQFIKFEKTYYFDKVLSRTWDKIVDNLEEETLQNTFLNSVQNSKTPNHYTQPLNLLAKSTYKAISWSKQIVMYIQDSGFTKIMDLSKNKIQNSILKNNKNEVENKLIIASRLLAKNQKSFNTKIEPILIRKNNQQRKCRTITNRSKTPILVKNCFNTINWQHRNILLQPYFDVPIISRQLAVKSRSVQASPEQSPKKFRAVSQTFDQNSYRNERIKVELAGRTPPLFKLK